VSELHADAKIEASVASTGASRTQYDKLYKGAPEYDPGITRPSEAGDEESPSAEASADTEMWLGSDDEYEGDDYEEGGDGTWDGEEHDVQGDEDDVEGEGEGEAFEAAAAIPTAAAGCKQIIGCRLGFLATTTTGEIYKDGDEHDAVLKDDGLKYVVLENAAGKLFEVAVHVAVAMAHLGLLPGKGMTAYHLNPGDKLNNSKDNIYVGPKLVDDKPKKPHTHAVIQYSILPLRKIKQFDTIAQAEKALGISKGKISAVCLGLDRRKTTGGYHFCYPEQWDDVKAKHGPEK
jgi:hypothetical protein